MEKVYFTIEPTESGFTDQLMQFNAFYKLGVHLGLCYVHTPFVSIRSDGGGQAPSSPSRGYLAGTRMRRWLTTISNKGRVAPEVHEFMGFNKFFEPSSRASMFGCRNVCSKVIELHDDALLELADDSFESLAGHVRAIVARFSGVADATAENIYLVKFRLVGLRGKLFSLIQKALPSFPDGLDLPAIYSAARARSPIKSLFRRSALKIVVHIRQGDTGVVETPWKTYVPLWHVIKSRFKEHDRFDQIACSDLLFEVSDYKTFLDGFLDRLELASKSVLIFSDGASRSFRMIESNFEKLGWSEEMARRFIESEAEYDSRQFRCFSSSRDVRMYIGEETMKLCQLINSAIESDIIIVSSQQRMIPKLVANFCGEDSPKLIILYKKQRPFNSDIMCDDRDRFIYFDIENPDYDALMRSVGGRVSSDVEIEGEAGLGGRTL